MYKLGPATPEKLFLATTDCLVPATWTALWAIAATAIASDCFCMTRGKWLHWKCLVAQVLFPRIEFFG